MRFRTLEETMDNLGSSQLNEEFSLEDIIEDDVSDESEEETVRAYNDKAASILTELDGIQNEIQNFYADMRTSDLPFFGFNELHEYSKKLDNTLHRAVDLVKKTKSALNKHIQ